MESTTGQQVSQSVRPTTIYDVARQAGVSHQTVSRYIRGYAGIKPATRAKVAQALEVLDYRPNLTARSLTTGRSHRIGALTHELGQVGPSQIVQGASTAAREAGYLLDIVSLDVSDASAMRNSFDLLMQHDLAGIIALVSTDEMRRAFEAAQFGIPAVIAGEADEVADGAHSELTAVGIPLLLAHLTDLGHTSVLHISGPATWSAARNRTCAFEAAVGAAGIRTAGTLQGDWSARSGYEAVAGFLAHSEPPTAVVAANDQMAIGAMRALHEAGLSIPQDVSVTGMDDIPEAAYLTPPLTTLALDFDDEGRRAIDQLLAHVEGTPPPIEVGLRSRLVIRRSTAQARVSTPTGR